MCFEKGCEIVCPACGEARAWNVDFEFYSKTIETQHTMSRNDFMAMTVSGRNSKGIRNCLRLCGSDYYQQSELLVRTVLEQKIRDQTEIDIPEAIVDKTMELYHTIKNTDIVFRSQGKWYIIGACMNYALIEEGVPRNRKEICSVLGISEKRLSMGENQLERLNDAGVIHMPLDPAPQEKFIAVYFNMLNIPVEHLNFVVDIIYCAEQKYLHIKNESRPNSRCIGAIYMLCSRIKLDKISKEDIATRCKISKSTFLRYYRLLEKNIHLLTEIFEKHRIPLAKEWEPYILSKWRDYQAPFHRRSAYEILGFAR